MPPFKVTNAQRRTLLILCVAFIWSIFIYFGLTFMMESQRHLPSSNSAATLRPIVFGVAVLAILGSVAWSVTQLSSAKTYVEFQSKMVVGIAIAEVCSIAGLVLFFLGTPAIEFLYFGAANIAVIAAVILPKVLSLPLSHK